jgi:hypothetical protein
MCHVQFWALYRYFMVSVNIIADLIARTDRRLALSLPVDREYHQNASLAATNTVPDACSACQLHRLCYLVMIQKARRKLRNLKTGAASEIIYY